MAENISSLFPIANVRERSYASNQLTAWDLKQMKKFFCNWVLGNPLEPETEWNKYYKGVKKANELFSANKIKGFATDRGRIYLKYGTADYIENSFTTAICFPIKYGITIKLTNKQTLYLFLQKHQ